MVPLGDTESTIQLLEDERINRGVLAASLTILYWDYLLTLPSEVERFWRDTRFTWIRALFFTLRYTALAAYIPYAVQVFYPRQVNRFCSGVEKAHQIYMVIAQILIGIMLNVRTYALYNRSPVVKWLLVVVSAGVIAVGCWSLTRTHNQVAPLNYQEFGCIMPVLAEDVLSDTFAWTGMLLFDTVIFALTLGKALNFGQSRRRTVVDVVLRDGTMYFGVMIAANLSTIVSFWWDRPLLRGLMAAFTNVISTVLICRLMLNIRDPKLMHRASFTTSVTTTDYPTLASTVPITTVFPLPVSTECYGERIGQLSSFNDAHSTEIELLPRHSGPHITIVEPGC